MAKHNFAKKMKAKVHVQNLKCGGREATIVNKLSEVKNIREVEVNQEDNSVSFEYHTSHDFEKAKHRLSMIGYPIMGVDNTSLTEAKSYMSSAKGNISKNNKS